MPGELDAARRIPLQDLSPLEPPAILMLFENTAAQPGFEDDLPDAIAADGVSLAGPPGAEAGGESLEGTLLVPGD